MKATPRGIALGPRARRIVRLFARFLNPVTLLVAGRGWMPIVGVLHHRGRITGRTYSTPLGMRRLGERFYMPLTFSENAGWYRNVIASGGAEVRYLGRDYTLIEPEVVDYQSAAPAFPAYELWQFRLVGINEYVRMRIAHTDARVLAREDVPIHVEFQRVPAARSVAQAVTTELSRSILGLL